MSIASERLAWLNQRYSYRDLQAFTGIPVSTISYVIREQRILPAEYTLNLYNLYARTTYKYMRDTGLGAAQARMYRRRNPAEIERLVTETTGLYTKILDYRFDRYKETLIKEGRYISDEDVRERIVNGVRRALERSPLTARERERLEYPTVRREVR